MRYIRAIPSKYHDPEEYETFQKASLIALGIPWDRSSARVKDMEIQGIQVVTTKGVWQAFVEREDLDEDREQIAY